MNVRDLAIKFDAYAHFLASRERARERSGLPRLICVAPDIAQERRILRVAQDRLADTLGLLLWTTTEVLLNEQSPLAPIWLQNLPPSRRGVQTRGSLRQHAFSVTL